MTTGSNGNSINPQLTEEELRKLREIEEAKNNPNVTPTEEDETPTGEGETPTVITPTAPKPTGVAPTVATPVTPVTPVTPTASEGKKYKSYDDVLELLKGKIETDEERKARERREKSRAMVNSIADAGRALANMWGATQYAPSSYDATKDSLSEKYQAKLEAERKKRDANRDWWLNYVFNMSKLKASDRANEQAQANWETQQEQTKAHNQEIIKLRQQQLDQQKERDNNNFKLKERAQELKEEQAKLENARKDKKISIEYYRAETKRIEDELKKLGVTTTTTTTTTDKDGNTTTKSTTTNKKPNEEKPAKKKSQTQL